jgi:hypothetical protein
MVTLAQLRAAWRKSHPAEAAAADTAQLGRVLRTVQGTLTVIRRGDRVLVWPPAPGARHPVTTVWHPRNSIRTGLIDPGHGDPAMVEMIAE